MAAASGSIIGVVLFAVFFWNNMFDSNESVANTLPGYSWRKLITVDYTKVSGSSAHADFPMLVSFTDTELKSVANGGNVESDDGYDLMFTSNDGTTQLSFQIEEYDPTTGELLAWVNVPSLSPTSNTEVYLYYGNSSSSSDPSSSATWNSNYKTVWHLDGNADDATSNNYNGTDNGTSSATGKIGNGRSFDGSNDYIEKNDKLANSYPFTLSAWVKPSSSIGSDDWAILTFVDKDKGNRMFGIHLGEDEDGRAVIRARNSSTKDGYSNNSSDDIDDGNWHYVVGVFTSNSNRKIYVDGQLEDTDTRSSSYYSGVDRWSIGRYGDNSPDSYFDGVIDEPRVATTNLSDDWILTEYNNQNDPSTFYTISAGMSTSGGGGGSTFDDINGATLLTNLVSWQSADAAYSTGGATPDQNAGSCWTDGPNNNVWFKFQAIHDSVTIDVKVGGSEGTMNKPYMALWNASYTELACAAYTTPGADIQIQYNNLIVGSWYYISVDNYGSASDTGSFTLGIDNSSDVVFYAIDSDDWDKTTTWSTSLGGSSAGTLPTAANAVVIQGYKLDVDQSHECASLTMNVVGSDTELDIQSGGELTIYGDLTVTNGGVNKEMEIDVKNDGIFVVKGDATFTRDGGNKKFDVEFKNTASATFEGDVYWDINGGSSQDNDFDVDNSATLTINGNLTLDHSSGQDIDMDLTNTSVTTIGGNIAFIAAGDGDVGIELKNSAILNIGGNFIRGNPAYGEFKMTNTSTLVFNGTTVAQTLPAEAGAGSDYFQYENIVFNNTSPTAPQIILSEHVEIDEHITFTSGVVQTSSSAMLQFQNNATCSGASSTSYVDGPVSKKGNDAFVFPVGKEGVYAPIGMSAPSSGSAEFTAQYFHDPYTNTSSKEASIVAVSTIEYWSLERNNGSSPSNDVNVSLYWTGSGHGISDPDSLIVVHWDGSEWDNMGNVTLNGIVTAGDITTNSQTGDFGFFTFGSTGGGNPLPIKLIYFDAQLQDDGVVALQWASSMEVNNDFYTIERSIDGSDYSIVTTVKGAGNSSGQLDYAATDHYPVAGVTNYYRLKQTDYDGKFEYFNVVAIDIPAANAGLAINTVGPNPFNEQFNMQFSANGDGMAEIILTNINGQIVSIDRIDAHTGTNHYQFRDNSGLTPGVYFLNVIQNGIKSETYKMVKSY